MTLRLDQFDAYYEAVHGYPPFDWQTRLLERVVERGWPDLLDLPTGSGKTSALDVALFSMALDAARRPAERTAPRRVVLVVDRRVVVSQAYRHAKKVDGALDDAKAGVLVEVREALRALAPSEPMERVVHIAELRGGIARDETWAKRPDLPILAASTVDQVGSRLLFRGYGVGPNSASIHAGLLGNDVLLLLDEVHLSEPFRQTLAAAQEFYRSSESGLPSRWKVVEMSATPGSKPPEDRVFRLGPCDRDNKVLRVRLEASKVAALEVVKVRGEEATAQATFADALAERALTLVAAGRRRVAVVVNRVNAARRIAQSLANRDGIDVDLVTGRMRPRDRDQWLKEVEDLLTFEGTAVGRPRIVVATQCIEAGADFDFDALVTECASLDALRQRFGRLNRQGLRTSVDAAVAIRSDQVTAEDPVYGEALHKTWGWLKSLAAVDFGIDAMEPVVRGLADELRQSLISDRPCAPILLPIHLDLWSQTSHHPYPEPELSAFLHGPERGEPEVSVLWRADLVPEEDYADILAAVPPASAEAVSLPVRALRAWLVGGVADLADVESAQLGSSEATGSARRILRWSRKHGPEWVGGAEFEDQDAPDAVYVLPAGLGGLWKGNWDPMSTEPVMDIGDEVQWEQRGWRVRRVTLATMGRRNPFPEGEETDGIEQWLEDVESGDPTLTWFAKNRQRWRWIETKMGYVLRSRRRDTKKLADRETGAGDEASFTGKAVTLEQHLGDVERWAGALAKNIGFPPTMVRDLALAGRLHDLGKADRRFQALLTGGSPILAAAGQLLAKSGADRSDRRAADRARRRSGYPRGARHELMSLALIAGEPSIREQAHDWELVQHLVASHHGWCRPFAPAVDDGDPVEVVVKHGSVELRGRSDHALASLDSGVADRFWRLQRTYGWWGLAWLEAVLRLADHRASEEEEDGA
ncbi:MAG: type I-U CRISPR-associated helicase/endonuclease Cas3 [Myxococcota bacterium]